MKRFISFLLIFVFLFLITISVSVYADPVGFESIAAAAYAMGQDLGFTFTFTNGASASVQSQMEDALDIWSEPRGGINVFGLDPVKAVAGKLAVSQMAANAIMMFLQDMKESFNISTNTEVFSGTFEGGNFKESYEDYGVYGGRGFRILISYIDTGFHVALEHNIDGGDWATDISMSQTNSYTIGSTSYYFIRVNNTQIRPVLKVVGIRTTTGRENVWTYNGQVFTPTGGISSIGKATATDFAPTVLNPGQEWQGNIGAAPDTNLDQLMGDVFQGVADTNLDVEGEIVDVGPVPTPVPTIEPGDIDGYWNRQADQLQGLGNDIGGLSEDLGNLGKDIGKEAGKVIDSVDGASEGIQDAINSQTGTVSGAIDQAISDVNDAIGEQTQSLNDSIAEQAATIDQSLTGVKEGIQDIAGKLEPEEIDEKTFDLRELFPFCIPFDIYHLLQKFDGSPAAPHVQLPIVIPSIGFSYIMDLDFSAWDPVAAAMRTVELIVYALGLAWATSKVIKW